MNKLLLLFSFFILGNSYAQEIIKAQSIHSHSETVKIIKEELKAKNLIIFAEINHQKAAQEVKLQMPPATVLIFGNPNVGTQLMVDNIAWSYELPLKIAIYEEGGKVFVHSRTMVKDIKTSSEKSTITEKMNMLLKSLINSIK